MTTERLRETASAAWRAGCGRIEAAEAVRFARARPIGYAEYGSTWRDGDRGTVRSAYLQREARVSLFHFAHRPAETDLQDIARHGWIRGRYSLRGAHATRPAHCDRLAIGAHRKSRSSRSIACRWEATLFLRRGTPIRRGTANVGVEDQTMKAIA